jgi:hypothetical protein
MAHNSLPTISATLIALSAISAATLAVIHGTIDGASFSAIIGAAIGAAGAGTGVIIANGHTNSIPQGKTTTVTEEHT